MEVVDLINAGWLEVLGLLAEEEIAQPPLQVHLHVKCASLMCAPAPIWVGVGVGGGGCTEGRFITRCDVAMREVPCHSRNKGPPTLALFHSLVWVEFGTERSV